MKPDKIVFKKELDESHILCELHGIEFTEIEGSTNNKKPLDELAKIISIDFSELQSILREYNLLDENNEISKEECLLETHLPLATSEGDKIRYSSVVMAKVYVTKKGELPQGKFKAEDYEPPKIYGNEQFIVDLVKKGRE